MDYQISYKEGGFNPMISAEKSTEKLDGYRYAFNGMERDDEVKGVGNSYDFGARIYDPRIGRWLAKDPRMAKQPAWSPYKAFLDNPIVFVDPNGETETGKLFLLIRLLVKRLIK